MVAPAVLHTNIVILFTHDGIPLLLNLVRVLSAKQSTLFVFYFKSEYHRLYLVKHISSLLCRPWFGGLVRLQVLADVAEVLGYWL